MQVHNTKPVMKPNVALWDMWSRELGTLELAARCIFTLAVMCDLWSMRMVDSISTFA